MNRRQSRKRPFNVVSEGHADCPPAKKTKLNEHLAVISNAGQTNSDCEMSEDLRFDNDDDDDDDDAHVDDPPSAVMPNISHMMRSIHAMSTSDLYKLLKDLEKFSHRNLCISEYELQVVDAVTQTIACRVPGTTEWCELASYLWNRTMPQRILISGERKLQDSLAGFEQQMGRLGYTKFEGLRGEPDEFDQRDRSPAFSLSNMKQRREENMMSSSDITSQLKDIAEREPARASRYCDRRDLSTHPSQPFTDLAETKDCEVPKEVKQIINKIERTITSNSIADVVAQLNEDDPRQTIGFALLAIAKHQQCTYLIRQRNRQLLLDWLTSQYEKIDLLRERMGIQAFAELIVTTGDVDIMWKSLGSEGFITVLEKIRVIESPALARLLEQLGPRFFESAKGRHTAWNVCQMNFPSKIPPTFMFSVSLMFYYCPSVRELIVKQLLQFDPAVIICSPQGLEMVQNILEQSAIFERITNYFQWMMVAIQSVIERGDLEKREVRKFVKFSFDARLASPELTISSICMSLAGRIDHDVWEKLLVHVPELVREGIGRDRILTRSFALRQLWETMDTRTREKLKSYLGGCNMVSSAYLTGDTLELIKS